ncbi:MAG TPA: 2Fe-2S iron-sulfur cluster-binding protein [Ohtaekwangia sp.]|nr:2Fe-2S iron-sulfur cluster-binding protein [Ohtaekwangia sp.]
MSTPSIAIRILLGEQVHELVTYPYAYRSLMALIYDTIYIDDFGDCKGIGRCGTCHVHILEGDESLLIRHGNETTTLNKMPSIEDYSRLSCNIEIIEKLNGATIRVVNDGDLGLY